MMKKKAVFFLIVLSIGIAKIHAQQIHSHNDYEQNFPFWKAYVVGASSIEADVFLINDTLFVAHHEHEIKHPRTLETLYLKPIRYLFTDESLKTHPFQLLIDIKSEAIATLNKIVETFHPTEKLLYPFNPEGVKIVISGSRPNPSDYDKYPDYIFFDWQSTDNPENSDKVAMVSLNFRNYSQWSGDKPITNIQEEEIKSLYRK